MARWARRTQFSVVAVTTGFPKPWAVHPLPGLDLPLAKIAWSCLSRKKLRRRVCGARPDVYIAPMAGMNASAALLARELRRRDVVVELGDDTFRLKKSFEAATKAESKYILIVGENEVRADAFALKNLASGEQVSVPRAELVQRIRGE